MISARISLERGWGDRFARRIEQQVPGILAQAVEEGSQVAAQASLSRRRTGRMAEMETLPIVPTQRGYASGFRSKAFYAGFQSSGTAGSRSRRVTASTLRRRQSASGQLRTARFGSNRGIAPLKFLEKGRLAARKALMARLNRL